jgi:HK97 family phage major capsid protein
MFSIKELREGADRLLVEARAVIAYAEAEQRDMTPDERQKYDALLNKAESKKGTADAIERNEKMQAEFRMNNKSNAEVSDADRNYECREYLLNGTSPRSLTLAPQFSGSNFGAFLASPAFSAMVAEMSGKLDFVRRAGVQVMPLDFLGSVGFPVTSAEETGEAMIPDDASGAVDALPATESIGLNVYTSRVVTASISLTRDAAGFEDFISRKLAKRIARAQSRDFTRGDGSTGHSEGIMAGCDAIEAETLSYDSLAAVVAAVPEIYRLDASAAWSMNSDTLERCKNLPSGDSTPVWVPPSGGTPGLLLGFPVKLNPDFDWVNETNRAQTLTGADLAGGTFKLSVDGGVTKTAAIPAGASRHTVQRALESLVGLGNVEVTGGPLTTGEMTVTFHGSLLPTCPEISVDGALLTAPGAITAAVVSDRRKIVAAFGSFANGYLIRDFTSLGVTRISERFAELGQVGYVANRLSAGKVADKKALKVLSLA